MTRHCMRMDPLGLPIISIDFHFQFLKCESKFYVIMIKVKPYKEVHVCCFLFFGKKDKTYSQPTQIFHCLSISLNNKFENHRILDV